MQALVIIPTYNELENIENITTEVLATDPSLSVLVVDDNSPDGTGGLVKKMSEKNPRVHLLHREKKQGLGKAYLAGFDWGLQKGFEILVEMDADFSHRPVDLKPLLDKIRLEKFDFAVGSRYVSGGSTVNWGIGRKIISRGGSLYSRIILGFPVNDWTGGFNAWTPSCLSRIKLGDVSSNGYGFQVELKYRALISGCRGIEVPITFEERRVGKSKMSLAIILEAFYKVWFFRIRLPRR